MPLEYQRCLLFYDLAIRLWDCSDGVVFFLIFILRYIVFTQFQWFVLSINVHKRHYWIIKILSESCLPKYVGQFHYTTRATDKVLNMLLNTKTLSLGGYAQIQSYFALASYQQVGLCDILWASCAPQYPVYKFCFGHRTTNFVDNTC